MTSLWAADLSDQLPVSVFGYEGIEQVIGYRLQKLNSGIPRNRGSKLGVFPFFPFFHIFECEYLGFPELNFFHILHIDASVQDLHTFIATLLRIVSRFRDIARRSYPPFGVFEK